MKSRKNYTIMDKMEIINEIKVKKKKRLDVCKEYNISQSTLSKMLQNSDAIKNCAKSGGIFRFKLRKSDIVELENQLFHFLLENMSSYKNVNRMQLKNKASSLAESLLLKDFKCSAGWFENWKRRYGCSFFKNEGRSEADLKQNEKWFKQNNHLIKSFPAENIYHLGEFGLFFRALPDMVNDGKRSRCQDGKQFKSRVTFAICSNQTGTERLTPLMIGRYRRLRCFSRVEINELPVHYYSNKKSWMTSMIFQHFLLDLNYKSALRERRVLLLVEDAPCHKVVEMDNVKILFLPGGVSPLSNGVVQRVKVGYRKRVLQGYLKYVERGVLKTNIPKWDMVQAANALLSSWEDIPAHFISNGWRAAGFQDAKIVPETETSTQIHNLSYHCKLYLQHLNMSSKNYNVESYINIDDHVVTSDERFEQELVADNGMLEIGDDDDDGDKNNTTTISINAISKTICNNNSNNNNSNNNNNNYYYYNGSGTNSTATNNHDAISNNDSSFINGKVSGNIGPTKKVIMGALHTFRQLKYARLDVPKKFNKVFEDLERQIYMMYS